MRKTLWYFEGRHSTAPNLTTSILSRRGRLRNGRALDVKASDRCWLGPIGGAIRRQCHDRFVDASQAVQNRLIEQDYAPRDVSTWKVLVVLFAGAAFGFLVLFGD